MPKWSAGLNAALEWAQQNPPRETNPDALFEKLSNERKKEATPRVKLDLYSEKLKKSLFELDKAERKRVLDSLKQLLQLDWDQVYRDSGLKWEKISSISPPPGLDALYSLRMTQSRRATAFRSGEIMRLLTIASDHVATYGKK